MPSQVITLIAVSAVMFLVIGGLAFISHYYTLDGIKSKTVGDGQHGTARWATKQEIRQTIALVADADCRLLLELRYLSMKRWEDIAGEMQMCRTSVYLLHRRALDMVETILRTREECARHDAQ